ncbi:MAG: nucleotidyltransferase domain-containing protein [Salinivirgaceae bacterium]
MNNSFGIADKSFRHLLEAIATYPEIEKAIIFGSRAMGNYKSGSDIDLAIFGERVCFETVARLHGKLNEGLPIPYFIDVVNFNTIELEGLKQHIINQGKEIYNRKKMIS